MRILMATYALMVPAALFAAVTTLSPLPAHPQDTAAPQRQAEAADEAQLKRALAEAMEKSGGRGPEVAKLRRELANYYLKSFRPADAVLHLRELLALLEKNQPNTPRAATLMLELAEQERAASEFKPALEHAKSAWSIFVQQFGENDNRSVRAAVLTGSISLYTPGEHMQGIKILETAYAQRQAALGPDHVATAVAAGRLAYGYFLVGRFAEAEQLYKSAIEVLARDPGDNPLTYGAVLGELAALYKVTGRLNEAEHYAQLSVARYLAQVGPQFPMTVGRMRNLGEILLDQRRYTEAAKVVNQALAFARQNESRRDLVAATMSDLARIHSRTRNADEAIALLREATAIYENTSGPNSFAYGLTNLRTGNALLGVNRYAEAKPYIELARSVYDKLPAVSPTARAFLEVNLGWLESGSGNASAAVAHYQKAAEIFSAQRGINHPDTAQALSGLGAAQAALGDTAGAIESFRKALSALGNFLNQRRTQSPEARAEQEANLRGLLRRYLALVTAQRHGTLPDGGDPVAESFAIGEHLRNRAIQNAILNMSARAAVRDPQLSELVRREQDLRVAQGALDSQISDALGSARTAGERAATQELVKRRNALEQELLQMSKQIGERFPEYSRLTNPGATRLSDTQQLLTDQEAMLSYMIGPDRSLLWVLTRDGGRLHLIDIGEAELERRVKLLRRSLDVSIANPAELPPFNVTLAHELYRLLIEPAAQYIRNRPNLIVVPHGPLFSLPFAALVAAPTPQPGRDAVPFAEYRKVPWLALSHSVTVTPSATVFVTLRRHARETVAQNPFIGFGDPAFGGAAAATHGLVQRNLRAGADDMRKLASLPETREELLRIAQALGGSDQDLFLGARATEANVKRAALERYRVIAFATHGLITGDLDKLEEPALALTPPAKPSAHDDGLLTMSEVLGLKINADWVVLSACNTAASDGSLRGEGLSGLAQAFFYAGSRALLVSLWAVETTSTQALTTTLFQHARANPTATRAEALTQAHRSLIQGKGPERDGRELFSYAHPFFWAAFILVGEGGKN